MRKGGEGEEAGDTTKEQNDENSSREDVDKLMQRKPDCVRGGRYNTERLYKESRKMIF